MTSTGSLIQTRGEPHDMPPDVTIHFGSLRYHNELKGLVENPEESMPASSCVCDSAAPLRSCILSSLCFCCSSFFSHTSPTRGGEVSYQQCHQPFRSAATPHSSPSPHAPLQARCAISKVVLQLSDALLDCRVRTLQSLDLFLSMSLLLLTQHQLLGDECLPSNRLVTHEPLELEY